MIQHSTSNIFPLPRRIFKFPHRFPINHSEHTFSDENSSDNPALPDCSLTPHFGIKLIHFFHLVFFALFVSPPQVAWIRKRDLHILTTGSSTYTSDQRFQVLCSIFCCNFKHLINSPSVGVCFFSVLFLTTGCCR